MKKDLLTDAAGSLSRVDPVPEEEGNYTYIVQCADGSLYTGWTTDLLRRLHEHNGTKAGAKYTHSKRPAELVFYERYETKQEAMRREYEIKQMDRRKKLELIHNRRS